MECEPHNFVVRAQTRKFEECGSHSVHLNEENNVLKRSLFLNDQKRFPVPDRRRPF